MYTEDEVETIDLPRGHPPLTEDAKDDEEMELAELDRKRVSEG
jgi:hypothetical protein